LKKKTVKNPKNKKLINFAIIGLSLFFIAVIVIGFNMGNTEELTGSVISVEYYGVSDELVSGQAGKIQTYIGLDKTMVKELLKPAMRAEIAEEIVQNADFTEALTEIYRANPVILGPDAVKAVKKAAAEERHNFVNDLTCLYKIATNHRYQGGIKLALVSELKYNDCSKSPTFYSFAYVKHAFWDHGKGGYICSQDSDKLFVINKETGKIIADTAVC